MWSDYVNEDFLGVFCVIIWVRYGVKIGGILGKFLDDF